MLEKRIEERFVKECEKRGWLAVKMDPSGYRGFPDRIVLRNNGVAVFAEFKAPGKKLRPLQIFTIQNLRYLDFTVYIIDGLEQIEGVIDEIQAT